VNTNNTKVLMDNTNVYAIRSHAPVQSNTL